MENDISISNSIPQKVEPVLIVENAQQQTSTKNMATAAYALQAASFLFGITFIIAVIVSYVSRAEAKGTWVASHYKWQIRTFWYSLLWSILGLATVYFIIGLPILLANFVWVVYRIVKGWVRLADNKEMYASS